MEMFFRILKKDLKRKRTINFILLMFIILATMFLASSVNNLVIISGAVDSFIEKSNVPDFFSRAMLKGEEDIIDDYLKDNEYVSEYGSFDAFNISNEQISIVKCAENPEKEDYERSNKLDIQAVPEDFMKVFNIDGSELHLKNGQIALAKIEAEANNLQVGDKISIKVGEVEQEFEVAAIVKDAVFGTNYMSFKRHFITQEDFKKYKEQSELVYARTYCINYEDEKSFESGWNKQNFNLANGVTKDAVEMCYIMDKLVMAILIVVSICLILIAFLVLRFTIVFTLQEDYKEIGIMKAIGMRDMGIRGVYMVKYLAISIVGSVIGFIFSFPFGDMLLEQTIVNIIVDNSKGNLELHIICAAIIVFIVLLFCYSSTGKLKKYSAMDAIRNGSNGERYKVKNHLKLWKRKRMAPCFYMAVNDILNSFKRFTILAVTFCIGIMLILLPIRVVNTLESDSIIDSFGMCLSDVYMDNGKLDTYGAEENLDKLLEDLNDIENKLKEHGIEGDVGAELLYFVSCHSGNEEEAVSYYTYQEVGSWEREYTLLEGREPDAANEVMITDITAEEMGVAIGDSIYFLQKDGTKEYIITGTYQSMLNLGKGFRMSREAEIEYEFLASVMEIQVEIPDMESEEAYQQLKEIFPDYEIETANEFMNSIIGGVRDQLDVIRLFIVGIVLIINSLITILMMKTIMAKERGDIALLKSLGFRNGAVKNWQTIRIVIVLVIAIILGTVISNLSAPFIIGPVFAMMGANKMELVINPLEAYVIYPLLLLVVTSISAAICAGNVRKVDLREVNDME